MTCATGLPPLKDWGELEDGERMTPLPVLITGEIWVLYPGIGLFGGGRVMAVVGGQCPGP